MDQSEFSIFLDRWKAIERVEIEELRNANIEDRWLKLNTLYRLGLELGLNTESESEKEVWKRWAFLRELK